MHKHEPPSDYMRTLIQVIIRRIGIAKDLNFKNLKFEMLHTFRIPSKNDSLIPLFKKSINRGLRGVFVFYASKILLLSGLLLPYAFWELRSSLFLFGLAVCFNRSQGNMALLTIPSSNSVPIPIKRQTWLEHSVVKDTL